MVTTFLRQARDFVRTVDDNELSDLHRHTLHGIQAMAICVALMAPGGLTFVLFEDVHPARALVVLPLQLGFYALLVLLARRPFGRRHTNLLLVLLATGIAIDTTFASEWLHQQPHSASLLFGTFTPIIVGVFAPWRPLLMIAIGLPVLAVIYGTHKLLGLALPIAPTTIVNATFALATASAVAIQGQRRLWWRFEQARKQLALTEREANERSIEASQRAEDIRRILDNVDEGFVRLDRQGRMAKERSAILSRWFGPAAEQAHFVDCLRQVDSSSADMFELQWQQLLDDFLPIDVALEQLPSRINVGSRTLALRYRPVLEADQLSEVILVVSDITAEVAREHAQAELRNLLGAVKHILRDRDGFTQFVQEATLLVQEITRGDLERVTLLRQIHTLKGTSALFELAAVSSLCHELETRLLEEGTNLSVAECQQLLVVWQPIAALAGPAVDDSPATATLDVDEAEQARLMASLLGDTPRAEMAARLRSWRLEPARRRLQRLAEGAQATALRLGKATLQVVIDDEGVRLPRDTWAPFWRALVHLVRNALDHGLEPPDERERAGKPVNGTLRLHTALAADHLSVKVGDDGRGIDWAAIRAKAAAHGLAAASHADLVEALFTDGISSRSEATEYSGRGVGMSALRKACVDLGGTIAITSVWGEGTCFTMRFPKSSAGLPASPEASRGVRRLAVTA